MDKCCFKYKGKLFNFGGAIQMIGTGAGSDIASYNAYISSFTASPITNETYDLATDTYTFSVPPNSDFSLTILMIGFMNFPGQFIDSTGLITTFGDYAFANSTGNNILGDCSFGNYAFESSTGDNTLGDCTFSDQSFYNSTGNNILGDCSFTDAAFKSSTGDNILGDCNFGDNAFALSSSIININNILLNNSIYLFAITYTGTMNITGNIGTTEGQDYSSFFKTNTVATINALNSKATSDGGNPEGDLAYAASEGVTVNYNL